MVGYDIKMALEKLSFEKTSWLHRASNDVEHFFLLPTDTQCQLVIKKCSKF